MLSFSATYLSDVSPISSAWIGGLYSSCEGESDSEKRSRSGNGNKLQIPIIRFHESFAIQAPSIHMQQVIWWEYCTALFKNLMPWHSVFSHSLRTCSELFFVPRGWTTVFCDMASGTIKIYLWNGTIRYRISNMGDSFIDIGEYD